MHGLNYLQLFPGQNLDFFYHYLSKDMGSVRLSTAFDSVTLYGRDPHKRPDIYGKIGNAGVSVASIDDAKKLYSGFNLCAPFTSVSMTINGPAPMILVFFLNAAIDQQCELYIKENNLKETDILLRITSKLIINKIAYKLMNDNITSILDKFRKIVHG